MQRRTIQFMLVALVAVWLTGCQHKDEELTAAPTPPAGATAVTSQAPDGKAGEKPVTAPPVGVNSDYSGPGMGSKGK